MKLLTNDYSFKDVQYVYAVLEQIVAAILGQNHTQIVVYKQ